MSGRLGAFWRRGRGEHNTPQPEHNSSTFSALHQALAAQFDTCSWRVAYKDMGRLVRRIRIRGAHRAGSGLLAGCDLAAGLCSGAEGEICDDAEPDPLSNEESTAALTLRLVCELCQLLEPARFEQVQTTATELLAKSSGLDEMAAQKLLHDILGQDLPTARVFKAITQNVIFEPIYFLREKYESTGIFNHMRDLREKRGWWIDVHILDSTVAITHHRVEICGDPMLAGAGRFECAWSLRLSFAASMVALISSTLRIDSIVFDKTVPLTHRQMVIGSLLHCVEVGGSSKQRKDKKSKDKKRALLKMPESLPAPLVLV